MKTERRRGWARLWMLGCAALVTAACGTRVSDDRLEAASYLDGTNIERNDLAQSGPLPGTQETAKSDSSGTDRASTGPRGTQSDSGEQSGSGPTDTSAGPQGDAAGSATGDASGAAASGPATGSEVTIGVIGTFSGPVGVYIEDFRQAIQVWGRWLNENGGLNGHRVRVVVSDDGGSPAGFNSAAQQLVEEEGAIAMAFTSLGLAPGGNNAYLDTVGVPTFGTEGGGNTAYENPYVLTAVPTGSAYAEAMMFGYARAAKAEGVEKIAIISCSDFSVCGNFDAAWSRPELQKATGLEVVYRARPSLTTPDFTSICIDARDAGADGILNGMDTASVNRVADACARQGYYPVLGTADLLARPELANNPNADGVVVANKMVPWFDTRIPGVVEMIDAFERFAPGVEVNGTHAGGWLAARFLQEAAKNLPADNPTAADVVAGLADLNGTTLGGLTYPLNFTPGQPSPRVVCFSSAVVRDGTFVPGPGESLQCR